MIRDFFCWEIYISIFIYRFVIIWFYHNILHEISTWIKSKRYTGLLFFINFSLALFAKEAFILKQPSARFIYYCFFCIFLQETTTPWIRCSWFRLRCVMLKNILGDGTERSKTCGMVTSIIWHVCVQFVGVIVFNPLASLSSSNYSVPFIFNQGYTLFFFKNCGRGVRNVLWSMQANSSPDIITFTYDKPTLAFLVTCTTNYQWC